MQSAKKSLSPQGAQSGDGAAFVTHLECSATGKRYEAGVPMGLSEAGAPLLVRYDLEAISRRLQRDDLARRRGGFWRYAELLPVARAEDRVSLGEETTPLVSLPRLAARSGGGELSIKDESRLPTGSFKARGLAVAVSMAKQFGLQHLAIPTNGNAGAAMSAYAARAGMRATVLCPDDTPAVNILETAMQGADVFAVNGLINDCGKIIGAGKSEVGWFDVSTLKEPYRLEGKKTIGIELAEQFDWDVPDVILFPTGGGTAVIGMWKAFAELVEMGWIGTRRPRMVAVQAEGCAPIVKAWREGAAKAAMWENAHTIAAGIRVPVAVGDFLILQAVRESGGFAMAVSDDEIIAAQREMGRIEGLLVCPEGAAAYAAYARAREKGLIGRDERAVIFNCATGLKYDLTAETQSIDRHAPIDYGRFV